jgi:transcriptional regulator with XRE-family HTH domain
MDFGTRVIAWLKAKGMTQKDLAKAMDVSPGAVSAWVHNEYAPSHANLNKIVTALGVTMVEFYGRVPKPKTAAA